MEGTVTTIGDRVSSEAEKNVLKYDHKITHIKWTTFYMD